MDHIVLSVFISTMQTLELYFSLFAFFARLVPVCDF